MPFDVKFNRIGYTAGLSTTNRTVSATEEAETNGVMGWRERKIEEIRV